MIPHFAIALECHCRKFNVLTFMSLLIAPVSITSLQVSPTAAFTLNCSSSGSPPTNVTWIKDGERLEANETFVATQYLRDGVTSRYDSLLAVSLPLSQVVGTYTCSVDNSISTASEETLSIQGQFR